jgi:hypothetical protein
LAFPFRAGWNDVADLDGTVSDDHAVDQQFEQRPLLIEVCFRQALPNTAAERLGMGCQPGRLAVPLRIMHEVMLLAFNGLQPGLGIAPTPLKLAQGHHPGEISLCEPFDLLAEGRPASAQVGLAGLQLLRDPVPTARPFHRVRDHIRSRQDLAQVAPD